MPEREVPACSWRAAPLMHRQLCASLQDSAQYSLAWCLEERGGLPVRRSHQVHMSAFRERQESSLLHRFNGSKCTTQFSYILFRPGCRPIACTAEMVDSSQN